MRPYYEDDAVTIYHGDCREIVASLEADVLVTDPPYGIGLKAKRRSGSGISDASRARLVADLAYRDDPEYVRSLVADVVGPLIERVGRAAIFPGPHMLFDYPTPRALGCVYMPRGNGRSSWGFQVSHPILYYGKDPYTATRPNGFWDATMAESIPGNPCPKPLKWMRWIVERASRPGETVLDPFMGSGTTLFAARERGRRAIGIEIEERYCEIAVERLAQEVFDLAA